jgi:hypothetical protein
MKHSNRKVSKKNMPRDLKRITNKEGKRVWVTGGREYASLTEINNAFTRSKP